MTRAGLGGRECMSAHPSTRRSRYDEALARPSLLRLAPLAAVALALLVAPRSASACSCVGDGRPTLYLGAGNTLPADAYGIPWYDVGWADLDPRRVRLESRDAEGRWVAARFTIRELAPGLREVIPADRAWTRLRISLRSVSRTKRVVGEKPGERPLEPFSVIEEVSRSDLTLDGGVPVTIEVAAPEIREIEAAEGGSCSRKFRASTVRIAPTIPRALEPFLGHLLIETIVDGDRWAPQTSVCDSLPRGRNWLSWREAPGVDVVYSECPDGIGAPGGTAPSYLAADGGLYHGVEPGEHLVQVIVSSPDARFRLASPSVKFSLGCDVREASRDVATSVATAKPDADAAASEPENDVYRASQEPRPVEARRCSISNSDSPAGVAGLCLALLLVVRRRAPIAPVTHSLTRPGRRPPRAERERARLRRPPGLRAPPESAPGPR